MDDTCQDCEVMNANHTVGNRRMCCDCYVADGNPPADWHPTCMAAYERRYAAPSDPKETK